MDDYIEAGLRKLHDIVGSIEHVLVGANSITAGVISDFVQEPVPLREMPVLQDDLTKKTAAILVAGLIATEVAWQIYKKCKGPRKKPSTAINEVIFFSEESAVCRSHANTRIPCDRPRCTVINIRKIISYMDASQHNLDICMYILTCQDLAMAAARAFRRGVVVRVIVDADMADTDGSQGQVKMFRRQGIKVRMKRSNFLMHHKFALVDKSVLISGSTNWTMQALHGNWDNIMISNQPELVKPFVGEFERLWASFDDKQARIDEPSNKVIL